MPKPIATDPREDSARISTYAIVATLGLIGLYLAIRYAHALLLGNGRIPGDFEVYWRATANLVAGARVYLGTDPSPFKYSPAFALLFRVTFFPFSERVAAALWSAVSSVAFFAALARLVTAATHGPDDGANRRLNVAISLAASIALAWRELLENLDYGQVDLLLSAALLWIMGDFVRARAKAHAPSRLGGAGRRAILWALILIVKPQYGLIFLFAAVAMGIRETGQAIVATIAAYALPFLLLGPSRYLALLSEWTLCLRVHQDAAFLTSNLNQTGAAVIARLSGRPELFSVLETTLVSASLVALVRYATRRRSGNFREWSEPLSRGPALELFALGIAVYLLVSPLSWRWICVDWIPLAALAAARIPAARGVASLLPLAPFFGLALLTFHGVSGALGVGNADSASFYGAYFWSSLALALALAFGGLTSRSAVRADDPVRLPSHDAGAGSRR